MTNNEAPYGFKMNEDGKLTHDEAEQAALAEIRALRKAGLSERGIEALLASVGLVPQPEDSDYDDRKIVEQIILEVQLIKAIRAARDGGVPFNVIVRELAIRGFHFPRLLKRKRAYGRKRRGRAFP